MIVVCGGLCDCIVGILKISRRDTMIALSLTFNLKVDGAITCGHLASLSEVYEPKNKPYKHNCNILYS